MTAHRVLKDVTDRIIERSRPRREKYLARIEAMSRTFPRRVRLSCGNLAHGFAACGADDKARVRAGIVPNIGIVTAYNDMLSAHQPYGGYPDIIKAAARDAGATAQVAGGVPAMCDGVTQGRPGMELSLFSRDTIALSTGVALTHDLFDGALYLGICDKIVPGLLMGALAFGHLPALFVPGGPMPSGISNDEKGRVRKLYAEGKATREELLEAEARSYHSPGTCTFYGTANSNQMLMELMGLQLPGSSFVNPGTPLRDALTVAAVRRVVQITQQGGTYTPIGHVVDERAIVNGVVGLHATGGSTNHLLHLIAIARAAGIELRLEDFDALASAVPLMARVYPNGKADVNGFERAGGIGFVARELLAAGLLHDDVMTVAGPGLARYGARPMLDDAGELVWREGARESGDATIVRGVADPFRADGGLRVLDGNLGRAVIKVSAVREENWVVEAPAIVFDDQDGVNEAFKRGELARDFVAVVRFQGPRANGMPELHKLTPVLALLQDKGFRVALVTDGRMSGASGQVPAAIHVTPEAANGGPLARLRTGDLVRVDARAGTLTALVDDATFAGRELASADLSGHHFGLGRELFAPFRALVGGAEVGASIFGEIA